MTHNLFFSHAAVNRTEKHRPMGNIELKGCCQLRKAFNIFNVRQTPQRVFENNFVEQITAQNYQQYPPEYWLILSIFCPKLVPPPVQDQYSVVGVWRYHDHPCGVLVCIRVPPQNHTLAFLCITHSTIPAGNVLMHNVGIFAEPLRLIGQY